MSPIIAPQRPSPTRLSTHTPRLSSPSSRRVVTLTLLLAAVVVSTSLLLFAPKNALAAPSSSLITGETNEFLLYSSDDDGVKFAVGYTVTSPTDVSFTLVGVGIKAWIAVGVTNSSGIGTSYMIDSSAAVIGQASPVPEAQEFELTTTSIDGILPWAVNGPPLGTINACIQENCVESLTRCQTQTQCRQALNCIQDSLGTSNVTTTEVLTSCVGSLANDTSDAGQLALGALLESAGCIYTYCADLFTTQGRTPNIDSAVLTQVQDETSSIWTTTLKFRSNGYIASIPLVGPGGKTTIIAAFGVDNKLADHGANQRFYLNIDLSTGSLVSGIPPDWVAVHASLMTTGLGVLIPIGVIARQIPSVREYHAPIEILGMLFAIGGAIYGSFYVMDVGTKPHHALGIFILVLMGIQPLLVAFRPSTMRFEQQRDGLQKKAKKKQLAATNGNVRAGGGLFPAGLPPNELIEDSAEELKRDFEMSMTIWHVTHAVIGWGVMGLAVVNAFLAYIILSDRTPAYASSYAVPGAIIAACAGFTLLVRVVGRIFAGRGDADGAASSSLSNNLTNGKNGVSAAVEVESTNPNFRTAPEMEEDDEAGEEDDFIRITPIYVAFQNLTYTAPPTREEKRMGISGKVIISEALGYCSPRTLTAIMGPSGAGKSTLLDLLAMRSSRSPEPGSRILVNGVNAGEYRGFRQVSGYVLQNDVIHQYLTVYETLYYTARLVMDPKTSEQQRYDRIMRVVAQLSLGHALHTTIGGDQIRGLSGGERRRVSVGVQLLKSPSLLFLDEPTSGLDAHTAIKLVESLRDLANEGRTVVATIHQPSATLFECFDRLVLLSAAKTVWSGSRTGAERFFSQISRPIPAKWNAADWYLTVVDVKRSEEMEEYEELPEEKQRKAELRARRQQRQEQQQQQVGGMRIVMDDNANKRASLRANLPAHIAPPSERAMRFAVLPSAKSIDVAALADAVRTYYLMNNREKLESHPKIIDECVSYALRRGITELDAKLTKTYGVGLATAFASSSTHPPASGSSQPPSSAPPMAQRQLRRDPATPEELEVYVKAFASSPFAKEIHQRIAADARNPPQLLSPNTLPGHRHPLSSSGPRGATELEEHDDSYPQSIASQIHILSQRAALLAWRDPQVIKFQAIQNIIFGLVLGSLYSNLGNSQSRAYAISMAMVVILGMVGMVTVALGTAVAFNDKLVFEREQSDHLYSAASYFFTRLIIGLPVNIIVAACLILPSYWWIGLKSGGANFLFFFVVNFEIIFLFDGVTGAVAFLVNDVTTAFGLGNFYEAIAIFMSGIFIPFPFIPIYWRWLYFITPFSYAYAAVALNQFEDTTDAWWLSTIGIVWTSKYGNALVVFVIGLCFRFLGLILALRVNRKFRRIATNTALPLDKMGGGTAIVVAPGRR